MFLSNNGSSSTTQLTSATSFFWWYHEKDAVDAGVTTNPYDKLVYLDKAGNPTTLTLNETAAGSGIYQFNNQSFFPVDDLGWNKNAATTQLFNGDNFAFTSELHYPFTYKGNEKFDFTGDDDVWAFINGHLAVDLGGLHPAAQGTITLDAAAATTFGLTVGGMYEIAMFHAERHTNASTYKLTLSGFVHASSTCVSICGDGKVVGDEVCDDGKNDGTYGGCMPGCKARAPSCGDAVTQNPPEKCDDGVNQTTYGGASKVCGPGCIFAPYCGDSVVSNGEACDEGAGNGTGYGHCATGCGLGPRCGDGVTQAPNETCDDGVSNGATGDKCKANCALACGDGVVQAGEQCDSGSAGNVGGYGKCNPNCTLGPRCGDGIKNGTEQCDDGKNDGTYGTCTSTCTVAAYCGDGKLQNPPETCDLGAQNSSTAYGKALCTNRCTPAPYCGNKAVDGAFGEVCDDGVNSGQPGSCTVDCKAFVPLVSCGDGKIQPPEQCDDGANNGSSTGTCDTHCRLKCGNGFKDPGEQCDNGVNDGSYGSCNANCTLAGYCGDAIKSGPEQCDFGANDVPVSTAYGSGVCTTACTFAPYCGDGRVQTQFGEQCDGTSSCDATCHTVTPK